MTAEEIRAEREKLDSRRVEVERQIDYLVADYTALSKKCPHPDKKTHGDMDIGYSSSCQDCGMGLLPHKYKAVR